MDDKEFYLDAMKGIVPEQKEVQLQNVFYSFLEIEHLYDSAINVVKTQLNILNNEFNMRFQACVSFAVILMIFMHWRIC